MRPFNENFSLLALTLDKLTLALGIADEDNAKYVLQTQWKYRRFSMHSFNIKARGILVQNDLDILIGPVSHCHPEKRGAVYNSHLNDYKLRDHNMLSCLTGEIEMVNQLCMAPYLSVDPIMAVFMPVDTSCHLDEEFKSKQECLAHALQEIYAALCASPFNEGVGLSEPQAGVSVKAKADTTVRQPPKAQ